VLIDAVVLAGGRSSRLGSVAKAGLLYDGETLLQRTLAAVRLARQVAVVGPVEPRLLPPRTLVVREDPPFSGPAAGIAEGIDALGRTGAAPSPLTLVLACDMPHVDLVVHALVEAAAHVAAADGPTGIDGIVGVDGDGRPQPLAAAYRTDRLAAAIAARRGGGRLDGLSVFQLIADLTLHPAAMPPAATADVDTWADARRLGVSAAGPRGQPPITREAQQ